MHLVWTFGLLLLSPNCQGSRRTVLALSNMGLDVWIVTGDNRRVAGAMAQRLGVAPERVLSEVLPAQKARKVLLNLPWGTLLY